MLARGFSVSARCVRNPDTPTLTGIFKDQAFIDLIEGEYQNYGTSVYGPSFGYRGATTSPSLQGSGNVLMNPAMVDQL